MPNIRRATRDDVPALLAFIEAYCEADNHDYDEDSALAALGPLLADDSVGQVWMLGGEPPLGYAVVTWGHSIESGGREALLDEIFISEPGGGLGAAAMPEILAAAKTAGARRIFLETESSNERARAFYGRHGFVVEDSVWMSRDL